MLVAAVVVAVQLVAMLLGLLVLGAGEAHVAANLLAGSQAFYLAESGLEIALVELRAGTPPNGAVRALGEGHVVVTGATQDPDHVEVLARARVGTAERVVRTVFERGLDGWRPVGPFMEGPP